MKKTNKIIEKILNECHTNRNKTNLRLDNRVNMILHIFDIKGEVWFGEKTDGVKDRI